MVKSMLMTYSDRRCQSERFTNKRILEPWTTSLPCACIIRGDVFDGIEGLVIWHPNVDYKVPKFLCRRLVKGIYSMLSVYM